VTVDEKQETKPESFNYRPKTGCEKRIVVHFLHSFLSGFAALLTCVFPMIPMTVSFLQNKAKLNQRIRNAIIYGIAIILFMWCWDF
jgi:thiol:disulfide interchange protein